MELFNLTGKTALVTGGNKGLGKGITEGLAEAGAKVVIPASSENIFETAKDFQQRGHRLYQHKFQQVKLTPARESEA